jgi:hypothetical protein
MTIHPHHVGAGNQGGSRDKIMAIAFDSKWCDEPNPQNDEEKANLHALIRVGVNIGAGSLTEESAAEWFVRFRFEEQLARVPKDGFFLNATLGKVLHRWMGLRVNADVIPRGQWLRDRMEPQFERYDVESEQDFPCDKWERWAAKYVALNAD